MVRIRKWPVGVRLGKGTLVAKVADGMSKTVMLSEVLTWNEPNDAGFSTDDTVPGGNNDWRGVWMIPSMGASAFSGRFPPNSTGVIPDFHKSTAVDSSDKIPACGTGIDKSPDWQDIPCTEELSSPNIWASARSKHNEGVNAALGDASVRFIKDDIDAYVWHAACTKSGDDVSDDF
jgi:hypothetical protein